MVWRPRVQVWLVTLTLVVAAVAGLVSLALTGVPPVYAGGLGVFLSYLAVVSWRSGGRFEFEARSARLYEASDPPAIRNALLAVCERTETEPPLLLLSRMDVPGAIVGYDNGEAVLAVDPRLPRVVDRAGLEAVIAHELGHLTVDIHTDAIRAYLPQVIGGCVLWVVVLAGQPPLIGTIVGLSYLVAAPIEDRRVRVVRFCLTLGTEALALAASRYANRLEEYLADDYGASVVSSNAMATALFEMAAVATGRNEEDVAGPIPWTDDRTTWERLFATHPAVEARAASLGSPVPEWARPYRPR